MTEQPTSRRGFLRRSAIATTTGALVSGAFAKQKAVNAAEVDRSITVNTPPGVRQSDVLFDPACYTAFPHVIRLEKDELLMAFRQAPSQQRVRHTHPRSVITIMRSYDLGRNWDVNLSRLGSMKI